MEKLFYKTSFLIGPYTKIEKTTFDYVESIEPKFKSGDLYYFKKNELDYLVLSKDKEGNYVL